ncbi:MAG: phage tail tape measure protein, partial [Anaerolineales bacterium]|nr:phage tail tape measure protein [Anaerolineales bacterium]
VIAAEKWTEERLYAALKEKRKTVKSTNKIAADLAKQSGWKNREVLSVLKKLIAAEKWTEEQLLAALREKRKTVKSTNKIAAELAKRSGWKQREVLSVLKKLIAAEKWTEEQLLAAIREKRNTVKSTNKIAAELAKQSGWKQHEILSRIKKLIIAEKWIEPHLRAEIERRLEFGTAVNKLSGELAGISGWKKWEISKMVKKIRKEQETSAKKADAKIVEEPVIVVDPETIINASKPLAEFVEWQKSLLAGTNSKLYQVRKWGDPVMKKYGFDVNQVNTTNFQAVGLYNDGNKEFGAISNFIRISHSEVMKLKAMQIEDDYVAKRKDWRSQKMNWLCKFRGTIYFFDEPGDQWQSASRIRWGTLALGGNLVQVLGTEMIQAKFRDGVIRKAEMARLQGFRTSDWGRPLDELLAEGLVHRCFCAYKSNHFGDSPKGIVYSPFFSVRNRDFAGLARPMALYIPVEWLEPKD